MFGMEKKLARKIVDRLMFYSDDYETVGRQRQGSHEAQKCFTIALTLKVVAQVIADATEITLHELPAQ